MLSRLTLLCLRQSKYQTGSQLLRCLAAASCSAQGGVTSWPQQQHHHYLQQQRYSSNKDAVLGPVQEEQTPPPQPQQQQQQQQEQQEQQQPAEQQHTAELQQHSADQQQPAAEQQQPAEQQAPLPVAAPAPADPDAQRRSKLAAVQPTQPAMQILKVLKESEQPLTSHELQTRVQQQYTSFPTRRQFKCYLKGLWRQKYVASTAPGKASSAAAARSGNKKGQKVSDGHWLFSVTHLGQKVDLNAPGKPLQAAAMRAADEWTQVQLPEYARHMREGRVPVTWQNLGVLRDLKQREEQYQRRLLFGGDRGGQQQQQQQRPQQQQQLVPGGAAAVADVWRQPQKPQKKQK